MKNLFLILSFIGISMLSKSQTPQTDSWKIEWNKKTILETTKENEADNTRKVKLADLKNNCFLEVSYKENPPKKDWKRDFLFFDEGDNELLRKDSTTSTKISGAELKKLFADKKKIMIYTVALPTDPDLAARIRIRRVHLCTLELQ
jgi:hypothetical protein